MKYERNFGSLDKRKAPEWYDKAKLGIFVHWGIYSVPAYAPRKCETDRAGLSYAEWYGWQVHDKYPPYYDFHNRVYGGKKYNDFVADWKGELFDAEKWMKLFEFAGARYIILTSKHHDAFCLWPSVYSENWNSVALGPGRDIVGEIMEAADRHNIRRGLYYSLLEWFHPYISSDNPDKADIERYAREKMIPQIKELVNAYKPEVLFGDGEWGYSCERWQSAEVLQWLFNESPVKDSIVVNDRWGKECRGKHGTYYSSEYGEKPDNLTQEEFDRNFREHKWEECRSISASFGFNRNERAEDYLTEKEMIKLLVRTVSHGGNLCLNVAPCADGTIPAIIEERLIQLGEWMKVNGGAIYETEPFYGFGENVWATGKANSIFVFTENYTFKDIVLNCDRKPNVRSITLLGCNKKVDFSADGEKIVIKPPILAPEEIPCRYYQVFEIKEK